MATSKFVDVGDKDVGTVDIDAYECMLQDIAAVTSQPMVTDDKA